MEELIEVLTEDGQRTGVLKPRAVVHKTGEWHLSVHVWFVSGGKVLMQKRSMKKESFPGKFDAPVAGHVAGNESCEDAALREISEEAGICIDVNCLIFAGVERLCINHPETGFVSNEFNHVYVVKNWDKNVKFNPDSREIENLFWIDIDELKLQLKENSGLYCISYSEFEKIEKICKG